MASAPPSFSLVARLKRVLPIVRRVRKVNLPVGTVHRHYRFERIRAAAHPRRRLVTTDRRTPHASPDEAKTGDVTGINVIS
jgi:hypothetical protein